MGSRRDSKRKKRAKVSSFNPKKANRRRKRLGKIHCDALREAWQDGKGIAENMLSAGLAYDPNIATGAVKQGIVLPVKPPKKSKVVDAIMKEADELSDARKGTLRMSNDDVCFCVYMLEKHGEDYQAMSRDPKNVFQETPKKIRAMINKFKSIPVQWNAYIKAKEETDSQLMETG